MAQYNKNTGAYDGAVSSRYEVVMLASGTADEPISVLNPLPVAVEPPLVSSLYSFNNFLTHTHRGWTMDDTLRPVLSVRMKDGSASVGNILSYDIGSNGAASSTIAYVWLEDTTITGADISWNSLNTQAEYRIYPDTYTGSTPNGHTGGFQRHSGIIVGKTSETSSDLTSVKLVDGANWNTMTLCLARLDSATKLDIWFSIDTGIR